MTPDMEEALAAATPEELATMAAMLQRHPLLNKVLAEMEADAIASWKSSANREQREELWHRQRAIAGLRDMLQTRINNQVVTARARKR